MNHDLCIFLFFFTQTNTLHQDTQNKKPEFRGQYSESPFHSFKDLKDWEKTVQGADVWNVTQAIVGSVLVRLSLCEANI